MADTHRADFGVKTLLFQLDYYLYNADISLLTKIVNHFNYVFVEHAMWDGFDLLVNLFNIP